MTDTFTAAVIPAKAGMTEGWVSLTAALVPNVVFNYVKLNKRVLRNANRKLTSRASYRNFLRQNVFLHQNDIVLLLAINRLDLQ